MSVRSVDANTYCRLVRPRVMEVFTENWGNETFDLNDKYYLFLAWGPVYESKSRYIFLAKYCLLHIGEEIIFFT